MFGYIKPFKPELKMREYDTYKAVYCGLCHRLGDQYGPFARLTLSYDFTFLAVLSMALKEPFGGFCKARCIANPFKKRYCMKACEDLSFTAASAMVMFYYKAVDNVRDAKGFKKLGALLIRPFAAAARKKAAKSHPELDGIFSRMMEEQGRVEEKKSESLDEAAHPTAAALEALCGLLSDDPVNKRILSRLGYLLGRWVYMIDALDDLAEDRASGGYNPFLAATPDKDDRELVEMGRGVLNLTAGELAAAYELLSLYRYKPILDNVIYDGLKSSAEGVFSKVLGTPAPEGLG